MALTGEAAYLQTLGKKIIMNWPGENLLIKLWDSLADKGVGSLLKPWQIRREGRANVDLRRYEMLAFADAEREVEEIRSGRRKLEKAKYVLSLTEDSPSRDTETPTEEVLLLEVANRASVADAMRKEINVAKAVLHAEADLRDDGAPVPEQNVDDDWLYRWRDYAGSVSADDLQELWGRILAGELKSPGRYSYRLLDFVRNLTKDEAGLIERIAPFVISNVVVRENDSILAEVGVTFDRLMELQELGVLSGIEALGLQVEYSSNDTAKYVKLLTCHGRGLLIQHDDPTKKVEIGVYSITVLGRQVLGLGRFSVNERYLLSVGRHIKQMGFKVSLVDCADAGKGMVRCANAVEITDAQQGETQQPPLADVSSTSPVV